MEWKKTTFPPLSLEDAVKRLEDGELSTATGSLERTGESRTDIVSVASVTRVEDCFSNGPMTVGGSEWQHWGVYDGHR